MISAELTIHLQGAVMNSKVSMMKSIVVAVALAAGVSGIARADDSSMSRFGGDSYAYFNNAVVDKAPSAWRQSNPNGVPENVLQAYSGVGEAWHLNKPAFDPSPSTFAQARPHGLTERDYQALSSEAPAWHSGTQPATTGFASNNGTVIATSPAQ
jgi:hypothetical protein